MQSLCHVQSLIWATASRGQHYTTPRSEPMSPRSLSYGCRALFSPATQQQSDAWLGQSRSMHPLASFNATIRSHLIKSQHNASPELPLVCQPEPAVSDTTATLHLNRRPMDIQPNRSCLSVPYSVKHVGLVSLGSADVIIAPVRNGGCCPWLMGAKTEDEVS
ncbi:hypothetical protein LIA77_08531 [Sarocladium implicatum]|nr:hypothetical protein LIA77_08531 [Sarocladium implicatum]